MIYTLQEGFVFQVSYGKNMHILYSYRSGTEEEYDELYQLLEDIFEFQRDMDGKKSPRKRRKKRQKE